MDKFPVSVHLMLLQDRQILLMCRKNTGFEDGNYCLPAGKLEQNESVAAAMCREAREELGIMICEDSLQTVQVMNRMGSDSNRIDYFFTARSWDGAITNNEPHKCSDVRWFPLDALPDNTIPYIRAAIMHYLTDTSFTIFGWHS